MEDSMSVLKIGKREIEPKFTFNSFKYMKEFSVSDFEQIETHPFVLGAMLDVLLMGAVNSDPRVKFSETEVQDYLEQFSADGDVTALLEESNFFKALQRTTEN
jgi:hypothetical protein